MSSRFSTLLFFKEAARFPVSSYFETRVESSYDEPGGLTRSFGRPIRLLLRDGPTAPPGGDRQCSPDFGSQPRAGNKYLKCIGVSGPSRTGWLDVSQGPPNSESRGHHVEHVGPWLKWCRVVRVAPCLTKPANLSRLFQAFAWPIFSAIFRLQGVCNAHDQDQDLVTSTVRGFLEYYYYSSHYFTQE